MSASSKSIAIIEGTNLEGNKEEAGVNDGGLDVNIQDQATPPIDLYFVKALGPPTTLTASPSIDDTQITVADATNVLVGEMVGIFSTGSDENRYSFPTVLNKVGNDLDLDTPIDFAYDIGDTVLPVTHNMNVDGSVNTQTFAIQAGGPTADLEIDITRIIINIITTNPAKLSDFGDITGGLTKGIVFRRVNGDIRNFWNVKQNEDFSVVAFDVVYLDQVKQNDLNGVVTRLTYGGQEKHGVVIRLRPGDQLQMIIQDDLSSLVKMEIMAQGHETNNTNFDTVATI